MSFSFARVLDRELKAAGLPSFAASACADEAAATGALPRRPAAGGAVPAAPGVADKAAFSTKAVNLSFSLRQYGRDAGRPCRSDPFLVTGWNEAGYLRDAGQGLCGEMRFSTASGTLVSISAGNDCEGKAEVRVRAVRNGVEHSFALGDFSDCRRNGVDTSGPPRAALPAGQTV